MGMRTENSLVDLEDARDKTILGPIRYVLSRTSTVDLWSEVAKGFNSWLNIPGSIFEDIQEGYRKYHCSNLLLNDIVSNQTLENEPPFCQAVYGTPIALQAMYHIFVIGAEQLGKLHYLMATDLYLKYMEEICISRHMEQYWNETLTCPTENEYCEMIVRKTYGQLTSRIEAMQLFSANRKDFMKLTAMLGLYHHILQDYLPYAPEDGTKCKIYDDNVALDKFSFPIIHAVTSGTKGGKKIMDIFRQRTNNKDVKRFAVSLLKQIGSLEYTKRTLVTLRENILLEIWKLGGNKEIDVVMDEHFDIPPQMHNPKNGTSEDVSSAVRILSFLDQLQNFPSRQKLIEDLLKPYYHIDSIARNNRVLELLSLLKSALKTPEEKFCIIRKTRIDDIQDNSVLRKGVPCSHLIYGLEKTINAGFYAFALCLRSILELHEPLAVKIFYEAVVKIFRGQAVELYWRENFICPTEEEYLQMVIGKTGGIGDVLIKLMKVCGTSDINVDNLAGSLSILVQIHDDYQNLQSSDYYKDKGFCEDLTEGKFGFPIVHAINTHPEEAHVIISKRTYNIDLKRHCLTILEKCGSFEYTRSRLKQFHENLCNEIQHFKGNEVIQRFLEKTYLGTLSKKKNES